MRNGFAIPIAWPETYCKQPAAWYGNLIHILGFGENYYYKVGHAALVLIDSTGNCFYFDFGRYHAPWGFGRARDSITDHELSIDTKALISEKKILNFNNILTEIHAKKACHGTGKTVASYVTIDFDFAYKKAKQLQLDSPLEYGPFIWKGTNCSRFVRTVILAGKLSFLNHLKLFFPWSLTPTPMTNVNCFTAKTTIT